MYSAQEQILSLSEQNLATYKFLPVCAISAGKNENKKNKHWTGW